MQLSKSYNLEIVAPFTIEIEGNSYSFDCLIKGYGAKNGMVVDENYSKISPVKDKLLSLNYGFSCLNIYEALPDFQEVLDDWGKSV